MPMKNFEDHTAVCEISTGLTLLASQFPIGPLNRALPLARLACGNFVDIPMRKKLSRWAHRELKVTTVVTAPGPMITARSGHSSVTAQSRLGHSSVTARSQLNHGIFSMITARSQLNHGSVTAGCDHFGHCELTVSSHGGQFFSHG